METKKELEPDLIVSKDGKILHRSDNESVRLCTELFVYFLPKFLAGFRGM